MTQPLAPPRSTREQIVDAAYGLFMAHGYDSTSVRAVIEVVGIAKGTFYHHFRSKEDLLDAMTDRLIADATALMQPILDDPALSALQKFKQAFARVGVWKLERRELMIDMLRVVNHPSNAVLRMRMHGASLVAMEPVLGRIIEQGVAEGVFHTRYPRQMARSTLRIMWSLGDSIEEAFLARELDDTTLEWLRSEIAAYQQGAERLLGAPEGSLCWIDDGLLARWFEPSPPPPTPGRAPRRKP